MLSKEEIEIDHTKDSFCVKIPLITEQELKKIDDNLDSITDELTKQIIHNKELAIAQHIIKKQKEKIDQIEEYLESISKQLDNVAIDQIPIGIAELQQENNKQNKIVDEMAEYLAIIRDCPNEDKGANLDCENRCTNDDSIYAECWKQYFEKKVESKNE